MPGCVNLSHLKKYRTRPSPPYPAAECPNSRKKGNDGLLYRSTPNRNGVCRWVRVSAAGGAAAEKPAVRKPAVRKIIAAKKPAVRDTVAARRPAAGGALAKQASKLMQDFDYESHERGLHRYALTWKDYVSIVKRGKQFICLEPQSYTSWVKLDGNYEDAHGNKLKSYKDLSADDLYFEGMFSEEGGSAVTGSGSDIWLKVTAALVAFLRRVAGH